MSAFSNIVRGKLLPPPLREGVIRRPRVEQLVLDALERDEIVLVYATAGSGKTTAVRHAADRTDLPLSWLTVDQSDRAPGRLLVYLAAALEEHVPAAGQVVADALAGQLPHPEAAALLAEAVEDTPVLLVIDELERLAGATDAMEIASAFLRYSPPALKTVLLSREDLPLDPRSGARRGPTVIVDESALAFTADEAEEALRTSGRTDVDVAEVVAATRGWVTGVLFEVWRSEGHVLGAGGEVDPLHGYLASQIVDQLGEAERDLLLRTSLLDRVTTTRAAALGIDDAGERLASLRGHHIPVTWEADGTMRAHPRFRDYLITRLRRRGARAYREQQLAYAHLLSAEGRGEEATEQFLEAKAERSAAQTAETTICGVVERGDLALAERWLEAVGGGAASRMPGLTTAEVMLAIAQERYRDVGRIADRLKESGDLDALAASSERVASMFAWGFYHLGRLQEMRRIIATGAGGAEREFTRLAIELMIEEAPPVKLPRLAPSGGPVDAGRRRVQYACGHIQEVIRTSPSTWASVVSDGWHIGALRALGRTEEALRRYEATAEVRPGAIWREAIVGPDILGDLGQYSEALDALRSKRRLVIESGSIFYKLSSLILEAKLELRRNEDADAADSVLAELRSNPALRAQAFLAEQADAWQGLALLRRGKHTEARELLRGAVEQMRASDRLMELPTAAVYWSEAAWRMGYEEESDQAAEIALEGAERQGSYHILLQALADEPSVLSRRIDAQSRSGTTWHHLSRALAGRAARVVPASGVLIYLREFGDVEVFVDGQAIHPRIRKSLELLAYLVAHPTGGAGRDELLNALFDGRADQSARSYLRQAIHKLREVLPVDDVLIADGRHVELDCSSIESEARRFEGLLAEASELLAEDRLVTVTKALELFDRGEYLSGIDSAWVDERRNDLSASVDGARIDAAEVAFELGRFEQADKLLEETLTHDPTRERAWQLSLRVAHGRGDEDALLNAYRGYTAALADLGLEPSPEVKQLAEHLRARPAAVS